MLQEAEQKIVDDVEEYGWSAMSVAPAVDSAEPEEWFTYTIGLQKTQGWPELICFGLDGSVAHGILIDAIAECQRKRISPAAGVLLTETLADSPARLRENSAIPFDYLGSANWYAKHAGMPEPPKCLQLIWPDQDGHFPDDPRCDPEVRRLQTPVGVSE